MVESERNRIQTACLAIIAAGTVGAALYLLRDVLIPFVLAIFLAYCLDPVIHLFVRKLRLPWVLAFGVTVLLCIGIIAAGALLATAAVQDIARNAGDYQVALEHSIRSGIASLPLERVGLDAATLQSDLAKFVRTGAAGCLADTFLGAFSVMSTAILVLIFTCFILAGRAQLAQRRPDVWLEIERRAQRYIISLFILSAATGVLVGACLAILGVRFAWLFGLLAFALNFIPNIGSIIATLLPLPVALLDPDMGAMGKLMVVLLPSLVQAVLGYAVQPRLMGRSLDLNPVAILLALVLFGELWGIPGMFLATPILAVIKILLDHAEYTRPLGRMLSDQPK